MTLRNDTMRHAGQTAGTPIQRSETGKSAFAAYAGRSNPGPEMKGGIAEACLKDASQMGMRSKTMQHPMLVPHGSWGEMQTFLVHGTTLLQHPMMHLQALSCSKVREASNASSAVTPVDTNGMHPQKLQSGEEGKGVVQTVDSQAKRNLPQSHLPFRCLKRRYEPATEQQLKVRKEAKTDHDKWNSECGQNQSATPAYRGVTRHKGTGRWEAHLWSGKHMYLGGFDSAKKAAQAYDKAVLTLRGKAAVTNFDPAQYEEEVKYMMSLDRKELVGHIRRQSSCWTRGSSKYRGVTKNASSGRWEARLGHFSRTSCRYLGVFRTEEEAARAYDIEMIKCKGMEAITNFPLADYAVLSVKREKNAEVVEDQPSL